MLLPAAGILVATAGLPLWLPLLSGTLSGIAYSLVGYLLGRFGGRTLALRFAGRFGLTPRAMASAERLINRYGLAGLIAVRVLPAARNAAPFVAGLCAMRLWAFLIGTTLGSGLFTALMVGLGVGLASGWEWIGPALQSYPRLAALALAIAAAVTLLVWRPLASRRKPLP
ncbi:MAG: DedA family protein [Chloroflexi bacterium]|nr:DedA family protein [Chloroflexota bacterium]